MYVFQCDECDRQHDDHHNDLTPVEIRLSWSEDGREFSSYETVCEQCARKLDGTTRKSQVGKRNLAGNGFDWTERVATITAVGLES